MKSYKKTSLEENGFFFREIYCVFREEAMEVIEENQEKVLMIRIILLTMNISYSERP